MEFADNSNPVAGEKVARNAFIKYAVVFLHWGIGSLKATPSDIAGGGRWEECRYVFAKEEGVTLTEGMLSRTTRECHSNKR
jgi:hypothetical protein